jgi:hypothetical protein
MAAIVPHFDLPFRFRFGEAVTVEQDSIEDVGNCVFTIVSVHTGWREEVPSFGIPDQVFRKTGRGVEELYALVTSQEQRAEVIMHDSTDRFDDLVERINVAVKLRGDT